MKPEDFAAKYYLNIPEQLRADYLSDLHDVLINEFKEGMEKGRKSIIKVINGAKLK